MLGYNFILFKFIKVKKLQMNPDITASRKYKKKLNVSKTKIIFHTMTHNRIY